MSSSHAGPMETKVSSGRFILEDCPSPCLGWDERMLIPTLWQAVLCYFHHLLLPGWDSGQSRPLALTVSLLEVRIQDLLEPERLQFSTSFCGELWESFDLTRHLTSFPGLRNAGVQVKNFAFDVRINYHAFGRPVISVSRIEEVVCLLELNLCLDLDCRLPSVLWFGMLPGPHGRIQYFIVQHCCYTIFIWTL